MKPLKVNQQYKAMVPRPQPDEFAALEADMIAKGEATEPIVINKDGTILDGHTRYEIAKRHGLFYETVQRDFETPEAEKRYVIECNLYRRHLSPFQKVCLAKPLEDAIRVEADKRMMRGTLASDDAKGKTSEEVAKIIGLKPSTYERAAKVRDEADVNTREKVLAGEMSINKAYSQLIPKSKPEPKEVKPVTYRIVNLVLSVPDSLTDSKLWSVFEKSFSRYGIGFTIQGAST